MIFRRLIHKLSTSPSKGDKSGDILENVILYYVRDPKRQSGVMIRQPAAVYRERREFKAWISLMILFYEIRLNRRSDNART